MPDNGQVGVHVAVDAVLHAWLFGAVKLAGGYLARNTFAEASEVFVSASSPNA